ADARQEAREALQRLGRGEDPARAKEAAEQKAHEAARDTVEVVIDEFMHRYMAGKQRAPRYIAETRRNFDNHVLPVWRRRLITTITRRDVIELLDGIVDAATAETTAASATGKRKVGGRIAANRTRAALSK